MSREMKARARADALRKSGEEALSAAISTFDIYGAAHAAFQSAFKDLSSIEKIQFINLTDYAPDESESSHSESATASESSADEAGGDTPPLRKTSNPIPITGGTSPGRSMSMNRDYGHTTAMKNAQTWGGRSHFFVPPKPTGTAPTDNAKKTVADDNASLFAPKFD